MTTQTSTTTIAPVSEETKALVEQKMVGEPDAIKQKMGELIELIKDRAAAELDDAEGMTREAYVKAMTQAKGTLKKTELFFQEQEQSLDQSIQDFTAEATEKWDKFVGDLKAASNRVDRAVDAAWKTLTEETPSV